MRLATTGTMLAMLMLSLAGPSTASGMSAGAVPGNRATAHVSPGGEDIPLMLEGLKRAPAHLESELGLRFKDTMKPELERFRTILDEKLQPEFVARQVQDALPSTDPRTSAALATAEAPIAEQMTAWQRAEQDGRSEAFLNELESRYASRSDRSDLDRLAKLRATANLAEYNARALIVFRKIVETVLLDGPEGLAKIPVDDLEKGIADLYAAPDAEGNYPLIGTSRDMETARQRILLMGLDQTQIKELLVFYESPAGKAWLQSLDTAYGERVRSITAEVALAYIDATAKQYRN